MHAAFEDHPRRRIDGHVEHPKRERLHVGAKPRQLEMRLLVADVAIVA